MKALLIILSLLPVSTSRVFIVTEWTKETRFIEDFIPNWLSGEGDLSNDGICNLEDWILFMDK